MKFRDFPRRKPRPTFEETIAKYKKQAISKYPLRFLGEGSKKVYMTEEERDGNFHILGTSGHGKSKYLEYHIRKDIDLGFGLCLIDPSDFGATFHAILEYCASINHQKVCIIDPGTLYDYGKVACIQALDSENPTKSVQAAQDAINILFGSSIEATPTIQENLQALLRMLALKKLTLFESTYFTEYEGKWEQLSQGKDPDSGIIREKFKTASTWKKEFGTTIKRLNLLKTEPFSLMVASSKGIDFVKMIDEGWVILCNLYPLHISDTIADFLGILIISQLHRAIEVLNNRPEGFGGKGRRFYLYVDEAYKLATPQIERILSRNRKSGFHLVFAHHFLDQISNTTVLNAIKNNTTTKMMFHMADDKNRLDMIKTLGFGGQISPQEAAHRYANLPKKHFLVKKGKEYAVEVIAPHIEKAFAPNLESYIRERLQGDWYLEKYKIIEQINQRIKPVDKVNEPETTTLPSSGEATIPDSKAPRNPKKTRPNSLFDLGAKADEFIRNKRDSKKD